MKTLTKISFKNAFHGCFEIVNNKEPVLKFYQCFKCIIFIEINLHFRKGQLHFSTVN